MPCEHRNYTPKYTHLVCNDCFWIKTDHNRSDWGIAAGKWFPSIDAARVYQRTGNYPDEMLIHMLPDSVQELLTLLTKLPSDEVSEFIQRSIKLIGEEVDA